MAATTKIGWTDRTVNAWWGCTKISPACAHCYADTFARSKGKSLWGDAADRWIRVEAAIRELEKYAAKPLREDRPDRVFIASMADVFEDRADLVEPRKKLWDALHRLGRRITPLILTKRPHIMRAWAAEHGWPEGAWAGTTVEDQRRADERIPDLLHVPAPIRFLSMEPLLEPVDLECVAPFDDFHIEALDTPDPAHRVHWVIAGGESGPAARPMPAEWVRSLRLQTQKAGGAFFFKQWGEWLPSSQAQYLSSVLRDHTPRIVEAHGDAFLRYGKDAAGNLLDGEVWEQFPRIAP